MKEKLWAQIIDPHHSAGGHQEVDGISGNASDLFRIDTFEGSFVTIDDQFDRIDKVGLWIYHGMHFIERAFRFVTLDENRTNVDGSSQAKLRDVFRLKT